MADGLHHGEEVHKKITFKNGFIRVRRGSDILGEEWGTSVEKTLDVPPGYACEVLGSADILFTKC